MQRLLEGYKFPVYATDSCPRNQTLWKERSAALNCTEKNGFACLPNDDFTELLEFCYIYSKIRIQKGNVMSIADGTFYNFNNDTKFAALLKRTVKL